MSDPGEHRVKPSGVPDSGPSENQIQQAVWTMNLASGEVQNQCLVRNFIGFMMKGSGPIEPKCQAPVKKNLRP